MSRLTRWWMVPAACIALVAGARAQEGKMYTPGPFDRLEVAGIARVELTQGPMDQVFIVGNDATQNSVQLTLQRGAMEIRSDDVWKFWNQEPVQVRVQMREITRLVISGASDISAPKPIKTGDLHVRISGQGNVRMNDLTAKSLRFDISGAGSGDLAGRLNELELRISGKGKLVADKLKAATAAITISGVGAADVWATEELRLRVSGLGTINYWGQPRVVRSTSGLADITAKGDK